MGKTRKKKAVPEQNPYEVPLYTPWDAARYLRIPIWAVNGLMGRPHWIDEEFIFLHAFHRTSQASLFDDDFLSLPGDRRDVARLSFLQFARLFVRTGVLQVLWERSGTRVEHPEQREALHRRIWRGLEDTRSEPIAFDDSHVNERVTRIALPFTTGLEESQTALIRKHLTVRLERVETKNGVPIRVYPLSREPADSLIRTIVMDPKVRFGRPIVSGRGLPTDVLFERHQAGDSIAELATDYDVPATEVEEAIRYESKPTPPQYPFFW